MTVVSIVNVEFHIEMMSLNTANISFYHDYLHIHLLSDYTSVQSTYYNIHTAQALHSNSTHFLIVNCHSLTNAVDIEK